MIIYEVRVLLRIGDYIDVNISNVRWVLLVEYEYY